MQVIWVKQHDHEDQDPQIPTRKLRCSCDQCGCLCGRSVAIHVTVIAVHLPACSLEREGWERGYKGVHIDTEHRSVA